MLWRLLPWKFLIRRAAKAHGFIDPVSFLARVRSFSQPSEVKEPMELVRANMLFQARGMINARAIQFNLDWMWPYWVEKQFDPLEASFIPRGYALTHVNLTHRNWTAVGLPDLPLYPLVDPRGLITPFYDGWSIDCVVFSADGRKLVPSTLDAVEQHQNWEEGLAVETSAAEDGLAVTSRVKLIIVNGHPVLNISVKARCGPDGRLAVTLRPYNPEGIQFIEKVFLRPDGTGWRIDENDVHFSREADDAALANYRMGDVLNLTETISSTEIACDIGMATAAAYFHPEEGEEVSVAIDVPLQPDLEKHFRHAEIGARSWDKFLDDTPRLEINNDRMAFLFEAAKRTLILLSAAELFPGPFTYRRFWFRDAAMMGNALLVLNLADRLERHLRRFPSRQKANGYFESQEGEWDSNGQVLWLADRWARFSIEAIDGDLLTAVISGADWIVAKRMKCRDDPLLDGLLPAGFSAEHLGPNDYYYWDDFWGIAGLRAAAAVAHSSGMESKARQFAKEALDLTASVFRSIHAVPQQRRMGGIPASPFRRMDAGAIGSMVADYPLRITPSGDEAVMNTLSYIMKNCFFRDGFFQDMVHSGINIYLTLGLAQTLLRAGDQRFARLLDYVAELASPTGQWPEAVHPFTGGGCMGDGQHGWAAAEWIMLIRNMFVREEDDQLVLGSGVLPRWIGAESFFGPTTTPYGQVSLRLERRLRGLTATIDATWYDNAPSLRLAVPGHRIEEDVNVGTSIQLVPL